jgi:hypothetical protein
MKIPPWTLIVGAWVLLIAATVVTVKICNQHSPAVIPVDPTPDAR